MSALHACLFKLNIGEVLSEEARLFQLWKQSCIDKACSHKMTVTWQTDVSLSDWCITTASMSTAISLLRINIVILTHWGGDKMSALFKTTFWNAVSWMKMYEFRLRFHWWLFLCLWLTIFRYWFRNWLGAGRRQAIIWTNVDLFNDLNVLTWHSLVCKLACSSITVYSNILFRPRTRLQIRLAKPGWRSIYNEVIKSTNVTLLLQIYNFDTIWRLSTK